ncbi:MAG: PadR family transcriptional regulator [Acidimicrobiales bacterium]
MADDLNATQGSLLGFLHDGPRTGWDLLQDVQGGLARFWNITPSHVYRELKTLEERRLVKAGATGARDRRPFTITATGRRAFRAWLAQPPGPEQIRFPLLVKLWFGQHLDPATLAAFVEESGREHAERLHLYSSITAPDPHTEAVIAFGIAYERAVVQWLADMADRFTAPDAPGDGPARRQARPSGGH